MTSLLTAESLSVRFGSDTVVDDVSFAVAAGECVALVGESGAGKSVTARSLLGLTGGTVKAERLTFAGQDLIRASERRWRSLRGAQIGLVLQDALGSLDPLRTIGREIDEVLRLHTKMRSRERRTRAIELLEQVGMPDPAVRMRQRSDQLSGGQRQRALIATAIAARPSLLIADEPTTALDVTTQARILALLRELTAEGTGLVIVSHDLAVVRGVADRVLVLKDGRVVESGPTDQVLSSPRSDTTRELLAAVPSAKPRGTALLATPEEPAAVHERSSPAADSDSTARADTTVRTATILRADGVTVAFGRGSTQLRALDGVSSLIQSNRTLGVVGESGSGKTTFARVVLGLQRVHDGVVTLDGEAWSGISERERRDRRRTIGFVTQDSLASFDPRWSVGRIISDALSDQGAARSTRDRVARLLRDVRLDPRLASRMPASLSGGQRQRVAIARALAGDPRILILDEPVSALDVTVQAHILDLFDELQRTRGIGYLLISHDLGVIRHMSDEIIVMREGRVVEHGETEGVLAQPMHSYTRALVADTPRLTLPF